MLGHLHVFVFGTVRRQGDFNHFRYMKNSQDPGQSAEYISFLTKVLIGRYHHAWNQKVGSRSKVLVNKATIGKQNSRH